MGAAEQHPLLATLPRAELRALLSSCERKLFCPDERILKSGTIADTVFLLLSGVVRIYYEDDQGAEITAKIFAAPAFFGETEALCRLSLMESASAVGAAEVLVLPVARFEALLRSNASFACEVVRDLAVRFAAAIYQGRSLAFDPITVRLANFVLDHLEWSTSNSQAPPQIFLTQEQMASAVGVSRRSITKDLSLWKELGILRKTPRGYMVVNLVELGRFADPRRLSVYHSKLASPKAV